MDINLFTDIKPTWDILAFNEDTAEIPRLSGDYYPYRRQNPLDENVALCFNCGDTGEYIYYFPKTGEVRITTNRLYGDKELSYLFGTRVIDVYDIKDKKQDHTRSLLYEMVIGNDLVYRRFEINLSCHKNEEQVYTCSVSEPVESCRYVFGRSGLIKEKPDHSRVFTNVSLLPEEELYDTIKDADAAFEMSLYQAFLHEVEMPHKKEILRALSCVKKKYHRFGFEVFKEIYLKASDNEGIDGDTPKRIIRELNTRKHRPGTAVRIEKDLVVVTGKRECKYLSFGEDTRAYFDSSNVYYFKRNVVTGKWQKDDDSWQIPHNRYVRDTIVDRDVLRNEILAFGEMMVNIKPSRIRDRHNKIGQLIDIMRCSDQIVKYTEAIENRYETEAKEREYSDGRYSILMPRNANDIIREGRELGHCVGRAGYIGAMSAGRCTILFLRDNRSLQTPLIIIEERDGGIRQYYGARDSYNSNEKIRDFINDYAVRKKLRIETVIYKDKK